MHHCSTGPGAWSIGQSAPLDPSKLNPKHNALLALVDWVENEIAPDTLIGTKYKDDHITGLIQSQRSRWSLVSLMPFWLYLKILLC
jgi:hypothetical protein